MDFERAKMMRRLRELHEEYMGAHVDGMIALEDGDTARFGEAIKRERDIMKERIELLQQFIATSAVPSPREPQSN